MTNYYLGTPGLSWVPRWRCRSRPYEGACFGNQQCCSLAAVDLTVGCNALPGPQPGHENRGRRSCFRLCGCSGNGGACCADPGTFSGLRYLRTALNPDCIACCRRSDTADRKHPKRDHDWIHALIRIRSFDASRIAWVPSLVLRDWACVPSCNTHLTRVR
jgi:hypothetical protein